MEEGSRGGRLANRVERALGRAWSGTWTAGDPRSLLCCPESQTSQMSEVRASYGRRHPGS